MSVLLFLHEKGFAPLKKQGLNMLLSSCHLRTPKENDQGPGETGLRKREPQRFPG